MTEEAKNKRILLVENRRVWSKKARCRPQNLTERHHFSHSITSKPMRFNDTTSKLKCTNALIHLRDRTLHSDIRTAMRQRATTTRDNTTRKKHFSMYVLGDYHPFEVERERERENRKKCNNYSAHTSNLLHKIRTFSRQTGPELGSVCLTSIEFIWISIWIWIYGESIALRV